MSDQAAETAPAEIPADSSLPDAAPVTDGSIQIVPVSVQMSDNGKLVGWVASAYGKTKLSARTEKNLRLLEHVVDGSLTLAFDLMKLLGQVTVSGAKRLHHTIKEATAQQALNDSSPPVTSEGGRLMLLGEVSANGINDSYGSMTELLSPQPPIKAPAKVSFNEGRGLASQPSRAAGTGSSSKKYAIAKLMQVLERDPDLASNDPELCRKTHLSIATICVEELQALNVPAAVDDSTDPFTWLDQSIAAKARNFSSMGVEHGEKYCLMAGNGIDAQAQDVMVFLHALSAMIGRVDHDYNKACLHNIKRLGFVRNPDDLSDGVIEGMLADAHRAGGGMRAAEFLMLFTELEDQRGWGSLAPRFRKIIGTD